MLRYWGWLRRTAQEPACTSPPQVCVCLGTVDTNCFFNASLGCQSLTDDTATILAFPLICTCVCSGAERVCPPGASAGGREDHCGGNEEQWSDSYWRKVSKLLLWKIESSHLLAYKQGFFILGIRIQIFSVISFWNMIMILYSKI